MTLFYFRNSLLIIGFNFSMKSTFLSLMVFLVLFSSNINASTEVDVIALEYPPFTTITKTSGGLSFQTLNEKSKHANISWRPYFLPPKRALKLIQENNWCASFYPATSAKNYIQYQLTPESIRVGLVRLKQSNEDFRWNSLNELSGDSVAILSTNNKTPFAKMINKAGLISAQVQTAQAGIQMVLLGRVDYAVIDNVSFQSLESLSKDKLQFSATSLLTTKFSVYINPKCNISLPHLTILDNKIDS